MALLDNLLGGGSDNESHEVNSTSSTSDNSFAANPNFEFGASDILHSQSYEQDGEEGDTSANSFTGIGDIGLSAAAPIGFSSSSTDDSYSASHSETDGGGGGGLLGGLL